MASSGSNVKKKSPAPSSDKNRIRNNPNGPSLSDESAQTNVANASASLHVDQSMSHQEKLSETLYESFENLQDSIVATLRKRDEKNEKVMYGIDRSLTAVQQSIAEDNIKLIKTLGDLQISNQAASENMSNSIEKMITRSTYDSKKIYETIETSNKVMTKLVDMLASNKSEQNMSTPRTSRPASRRSNHVATDLSSRYSGHHEDTNEEEEFQNYDIGNQDSTHNASFHPNDQENQPHGSHLRSNSAHQQQVPNKRSPQGKGKIFNLNEFAIAVQDKVKYTDIDKHLEKIVLQDDSMFHLEQVYSRIMMAITYGFNTTIEQLPSYQELHPNIDFRSIFLKDLVSDEVIRKVSSMFNRIGELIKMRLTNEECISSTRSPKMAKIIAIYKSFDGWTILEKILKDRVVLCGAVADNDLDVQRASLQLMDGEEYSAFYVRCHELQAEYELTMKNVQHVPYIKILQIFLDQLRRVQAYVPYLLPFQQTLRFHIKRYGDVDNSFGIPFTIHDVYGILQDNQVPEIPPTLDGIKNNGSNQQQSSNTISDGALLASSEVWLDENFEPTMNAFQRIKKMGANRCKCCLIGIHSADQCYLRGPDFMPTALKQRIALYNKQHGTTRPANVPIKDWNPKSIPPSFSSNKQKQVKFGDDKKPAVSNPFKNTPTKTKTKTNNNMSVLESKSEEDIIEELLGDDINEHEEINANLSSFIASQEQQMNTYMSIDEDDDHEYPVLCSATRTVTFEPKQINTAQPMPVQVCNFTPSSLVNILQTVHARSNYNPNRRFLLQHSLAISSLPSSAFRNYCVITLHLDSGANVSALKNKNLFYFFIDKQTKAQQVDGSSFMAEGWGGILVSIGLNTYLVTPVFYCPDNPRNTLSPQALISFTGFRKAIIDIGNRFVLVDQFNNKHVINTIKENDLDFVDLNIVTFQPNNLDDDNEQQASLCSMMMMTSITESDSSECDMINEINMSDWHNNQTRENWPEQERDILQRMNREFQRFRLSEDYSGDVSIWSDRYSRENESEQNEDTEDETLSSDDSNHQFPQHHNIDAMLADMAFGQLDAHLNFIAPRNTTPLALLQHIDLMQSKNVAFGSSQNQLLQSFPINYFETYCTVGFHIDGGSNCCVVNEKDYLYFYVDETTNLNQINGNFQCEGWGGTIIELNGNIYAIAPVFYSPTIRKNVLSPSAMKHCAFTKVIIDTNENISFIDSEGRIVSKKLVVRNTLDYVDIEIMKFHPSKRHMEQSQLVYYLQNIQISDYKIQEYEVNMVEKLEEAHDKQQEHQVLIVSDNETNELQTKHTMHHKVMEYYIALHSYHSPRENAINTLNQVFNNSYSPRQIAPNQHSRLVRKSINEKQPIMNTLQSADDANEDIIEPIMCKLTRASKQYYSPLQQYQRLHISTLHMSDSMIREMIRHGTLVDLPKTLLNDVKQFNCQCYICMLSKTNKLPRGGLEDKTALPPFGRVHLDFHFFSTTSIRGFSSALAAVCASTSYPFNFPTKSKTPPIAIALFLIRTIRSMGFQIHIIRVDEDGALSKSSEFCKLIVNENIVLQTTGGGNSENNGMVERANQFDANVIRPVLSTMNILMGDKLPATLPIESFWCCALQMSTMVHRRVYNRMRGDSPYFLVHKKRASIKELVPCGALMTIVDPNKNKLPKLSRERAKRGYFCAFGNNLKVMLYWDETSPKILKRSYHAIVEDTATFAILEKKIFSVTNGSDFEQQHIPDEIKQKTVTKNMFDICDTGFPHRQVKSITITLPPHPTPLGLKLCDDTLYNLPFIQSTVRNSFAYDKIPTRLRQNHYIIAINADCPITKEYVIDMLKEIQKSDNRTCTIELVHRGHADNTTSLSISRVIFDNFPSYLQQKPIISSLLVPPTHEHFVSSPVKPDRPKSFFECLKHPLKRNWIAAAKIMFKKNKRIAVFSLPFLKKDLPEGQKVLRTLLVPEWKPTELSNVWEPRIRECVVGTPQQRYLDFDNSYAAVVDPTSVKCHIAYASATMSILLVYDISNAFQNTFNKPGHDIFVTVPPTYMEWLHEEEGFQYDKNQTYYRQMFNANQGTKDAANQWKGLLVSILDDYGLKPSKVDHALFWKVLDDGKMMIVSVATDDLLVSLPSYSVAHDFKLFLQQYFQITLQVGKVLKFLGIRIVQTDHAISIDQSEYIFEALEKYFGQDCEKVKTISTPMRYDNNYERELYEAIPLEANELTQYAINYNGTYRYHTGTLGFAANLTRWDIKYAVQRLAEYNNHPTSVSFQSISRLYRYLAGDPHRPIVFPRDSLNGTSRLTYHITPAKESELIIPNAPTNFNDAELGRCLASRKSYYCTMICVLGVIVQMRVKKSETIMTHTTDSEMKANFEGCRSLIPVRTLFQEMGVKLHKPSVLFCDNKAVVDIINSERMTTRCRHIDIPIAFLHHHKDLVYKEHLITTDKMLADMGTKPNSPAVHKRFKYWGSGQRFLPPPDHEHYEYLQMKYYEKPFCEIIEMMRKGSFQNNNSVISQDGGVVVGQTCDKQSSHTRSLTTSSHINPRHKMKD